MNSLGANLTEGRKVIMQGDGTEESRTVTIKGGFGMVAFTTGTALMVEFPDGTTGRMDAMEIEKLVVSD